MHGTTSLKKKSIVRPSAAFTMLEDFPTTGSALATCIDISSTIVITKNVLLLWD